MTRTWIAVALLAGSWMFGLGYYPLADLPAWAALVAVATVLLAQRPDGRFGQSVDRHAEHGWKGDPWNAAVPAAAIVLLLPAVWFLPTPYRAVPLLLALGAALCLAPIPRNWPRAFGWGAVRSGTVLAVQGVAMLAYSGHTARNHDLPAPVTSLVAALVSAFGADATVDGPAVAIRSMRRVHRMPVTWELLFDPVTVCFLFGSLAIIALAAWNAATDGRRKLDWIRPAVVLALVVAAWLPIRLGLMLGFLLDRAIVTRLGDTLTVMDQFLSPWVLMLLLLCPPVLLAARFVRLPRPDLPSTVTLPDSASTFRPVRLVAAAVCVFVAAGLVAFVFTWDPVGIPKAGRVMVVERHSTWEPTMPPYSTTRYGEAGSYNYAAIYDYCSRFFEMSRLLDSDKKADASKPPAAKPDIPQPLKSPKLEIARPSDPQMIDDNALRECDVLVIKTPTERYAPEEVWAIERFVRQGGGLLLIGDHTNVFGTSSFLNEIARPFGFQYRHDLLFRIGKAYDQEVLPAAVPHPAVQYLPPMFYAVSCSIDPGRSFGRAAIQNAGLWSLMPDYHQDNFHPQAEYLPEMRYGSFIQLWATRHGNGRVMAFTDSTIFSSFSTFQPGKAEMMLGMLDWLNHTSRLDRASARWLVIVALLLVAAVLLAAGLWLAGALPPFSRSEGAVPFGPPAAPLLLIAAALLGTTVGIEGTAAAHRRAMPEPEAVRPMTRLVIDRTLSDVPLSLGAFPTGDGTGYGLMEQWLPRLGCFITRRSGAEAFIGDALVVICPSESVSEDYRRQLIDYVAGGGKLLVIDSLENQGTTANSLLWPFGMAVEHANPPKGTLSLLTGWPDIEVTGSCRIIGGEPLMWVGDTPVAAQATYGKGSVMAFGFGAIFNDDNMGGHWLVAPDRATALRYDTLFALVRGLLSGKPVEPPKPEESAVTHVAADKPAEE